MNSLVVSKPAEHLQIVALIGLQSEAPTAKVDAILALEELTRRAQVEEQRQAAENAARRALGEERG